MDFYVFLKPSDDVRHICGANRDNFKHFRDTPSYKSISFDFDCSVYFPTDAAVSGILNLDALSILRITYSKQQAFGENHRIGLKFQIWKLETVGKRSVERFFAESSTRRSYVASRAASGV